MNLKNNDPWKLNAMTALWRKDGAPELPLDEIPIIDNSYAIEIGNQSLKNGQSVLIEYLPALVYLNGFDFTQDGVNDLRICSGTLSEVTAVKNIEGCLYENTVQNASILVESTYDISHFKDSVQSRMNTTKLEDDFISSDKFKNLYRVGDYIFLSWATDSYFGNDCLIVETEHGFDVLYSHEWSFRSASCVKVGRVKLTANLSDRLRARLDRLNNLEQQWSGNNL